MRGQANDYSAKWSLFLIGPGLMAGIMLLFYFLPWLSPKHWEVDTFQSTYLYVMVVLVSMLAYFTGVSLWVGLGRASNVSRAVIGGVCLLFALLGNIMGKVRRNFFIGVRTPWTLANERVWNATHRCAAKTFVLGGVIGRYSLQSVARVGCHSLPSWPGRLSLLCIRWLYTNNFNDGGNCEYRDSTVQWLFSEVFDSADTGSC